MPGHASISKQRLARKLGAPQRRPDSGAISASSRRGGVRRRQPPCPAAWLFGTSGTRAISVVLGRAAAARGQAPREGGRLSSFIGRSAAKTSRTTWAKISKGGVKPMAVPRRRSLDSIGVGRTVPAARTDAPRLIMRGVRWTGRFRDVTTIRHRAMMWTPSISTGEPHRRETGVRAQISRPTAFASGDQFRERAVGRDHRVGPLWPITWTSPPRCEPAALVPPNNKCRFFRSR